MYSALNIFVSLLYVDPAIIGLEDPFIILTLLSLYRYVRLIVNLFAFTRLRPTPIPENPRLTSLDVTVVIPSIEGGGEVLTETIRSILATEPYEIILITIHANLLRAQMMVEAIGTSKIRIQSVAHPNKRRQMVRAIPEITTNVTVFADDDVLWPPRLLPWMLAPLEDEQYGGVGTNQRLRRGETLGFQQRIYAYLNALYLERRNFDCASCMYMDGGLPCLSGRTVAYRSKIIKDEAFIQGFTNEEWLGRYQLNADDDNFITRWLVSHDKKIGFQYHKEAEVLTTLEDNPNFVKQCLRWSRSNWRSNITSMFCDRYIWRRQPWSTYAVYQTTIVQWAFIWDCLIIYCYHTSTKAWDDDTRLAGLAALLAWMLMSKFLKLLGHYVRYPTDLLLLPVSITFGYLHGLIKARAMLSLNVTAWGTRDGADDDDAYRMIRVNHKQQEAGGLVASEAFFHECEKLEQGYAIERPNSYMALTTTTTMTTTTTIP